MSCSRKILRYFSAYQLKALEMKTTACIHHMWNKTFLELKILLKIRKQDDTIEFFWQIS